MKNITKILLLGLILTLFGCLEKVNKTIKKLSSNVTEPVYTPFNLPQSKIELPSIFVGKENSVENACFISTTDTISMNAQDSLKILVYRDTKMTASLQAEFEKELVKAGLDASLASSTSKKISIDVKGIKIVKLKDISKIKPDFRSATCNTQALNFYVNNRTIITQALKAEKYIVSTSSALSNEIKAKLNATIDTLNLKLGMAFERAVNASGEFEYTATNVFFGALTTKLAVVECKIDVRNAKIEEGMLYEVSNNKLCSNFQARFKRSKMSNDFTVEIYPQNNPQIGSGQIDIKEGVVTSVLINDVSIAAVTIDQKPKSDKFNISLSIYIVGVDAEQIQN